MNFELSAEQAAVRDRARAFAGAARARAAEIDQAGVIPAPLVRDARALCDADPLPLAVVIEQIATASAALAIAAAASEKPAPTLDLSGLRGAPALASEPRSQLVLAAVALGIGRAALEVSIEELRQSTVTPGADVEKPHWVVADAATEIDAARLLTHKAARTMADADVAIARLMATAAADRAVDAALRVAGSDALKQGSALERLARDVRAVALILGTEENQRAVAADALFPR